MTEKEEKTELITISTKITPNFNKVIEDYLKMDSHVTISEFIRDSMRDKIKKDAPYLMESMFDESKPSSNHKKEKIKEE